MTFESISYIWQLRKQAQQDLTTCLRWPQKCGNENLILSYRPQQKAVSPSLVAVLKFFKMCKLVQCHVSPDMGQQNDFVSDPYKALMASSPHPAAVIQILLRSCTSREQITGLVTASLYWITSSGMGSSCSSFFPGAHRVENFKYSISSAISSFPFSSWDRSFLVFCILYNTPAQHLVSMKKPEKRMNGSLTPARSPVLHALHDCYMFITKILKGNMLFQFCA